MPTLTTIIAKAMIFYVLFSLLAVAHYLCPSATRFLLGYTLLLIPILVCIRKVDHLWAVVCSNSWRLTFTRTKPSQKDSKKDVSAQEKDKQDQQEQEKERQNQQEVQATETPHVPQEFYVVRSGSIGTIYYAPWGPYIFWSVQDGMKVPYFPWDPQLRRLYQSHKQPRPFKLPTPPKSELPPTITYQPERSMDWGSLTDFLVEEKNDLPLIPPQLAKARPQITATSTTAAAYSSCVPQTPSFIRSIQRRRNYKPRVPKFRRAEEPQQQEGKGKFSFWPGPAPEIRKSRTATAAPPKKPDIALD